MARPVATDDQRQEQRDRIRHAAANLYREGGPTALTARAVAAEAGVSTGLLYRYFANMSDLMRSLWIGPVIEFGRRVDTIIAETVDPLARIEALLTAYVEWAIANPEVLRGLLLFVRPGPAELPPQQHPDDLALPRALKAAIVDGQSAGTIRAGDPTELAQVLWAGVHGALALPINLDRFSITPSAELGPGVIAALLASLES